MPSFPDVTLQTDGPLTISELVESDASSLLKAVNDRDLRRWLPLPSPYTEDMAVQWCTSISRDMRETGRGFVLGIRDGGGLVGSIDAKRVDWRR